MSPRKSGVSVSNLVERGTQGINIGSPVERSTAAECLLGAHVSRSAEGLVGFSQVEAAADPGQAEIGDPEVALFIDQEVRGLDVAMQDVVGVGVFQGRCGLSGEPGDIALETRALVEEGPASRDLATLESLLASVLSSLPQFVDDPGKVAAIDVLHRVVSDPILRSSGENRHDVRVSQARGGLCLDLESVQPPGIERRGFSQDLEGDTAGPEDILDRLVDDTHPASAQLADDSEVAQVAELDFV